ncbi:HesA/MoeB/ThiF family protein [Paramaledivibacter caminithermalis]|uniref:Molybdopterin or thiamine biosynthesis adenylyltransferase n=1 Tax=Paramaledivibacter caminithermalis (strain DSM 15212 / CIP 107654 / DViRD3) TaxID=1121301 RepID=A0A1M6KWW0_PARC5|nr:HesA/MoeB/ThiF family protein [Paramaledivibacter caminithermalis]SHJ63386.1 Molybdopterin or thiamine biosynthesis adenylyltransferase [Paramaledivibacter caminithermalis DSM 15212]
MKRYIRNMNMLSKEENEKLKDFKVCVVGCGGLGGYIIEMLGRLGIGHITAVDGDVFDETNLNRQVLSDVENLGKSKAMIAQRRMKLVNPLIEIVPIDNRITEENAEKILCGHHLIIDAIDNIYIRFLLQDTASKLNIPMIHGAIAGWYGQVATIFPGDKTLEKIYPQKDVKGLENEIGNPSFTPALIASIQVSEALKILLNKGEILRHKLLYIDLLEHNYMIMEL